MAAAKERRDELSAARRRGLAARHAAKLRNLKDTEQQRAEDHDGHDNDSQDDQPDDQDHDDT